MLWIYCLAGAVSEDQVVGDGFVGNWHEDDHSFLFFTREADTLVNTLVARDEGLELIDHFVMSYAQWQGDNLNGFRVERFHFTPPWEEAATDPGIISITLDPGVVFGDGSHPTTRDCLKAIERFRAQEGFARVLDLGTGSGLLALAAAHLGARMVVAVDYTLLAARTAQRNTELNSLTDRIIVVNGRAEDFIHIPSDLLLANLPYPVMKDLVSSDGFLTQRRFVLSGLQSHEAETIKATLATKPIDIHHCAGEPSSWQTILGEIRS